MKSFIRSFLLVACLCLLQQPAAHAASRRRGPGRFLPSRHTKTLPSSTAGQRITAPSISSEPGNRFPEATASVPSEIFNLIKTIVGAGVLGLPAGIATFGDEFTAVYPALLAMLIIGSLAGYAFYLLGILCRDTNSVSYQEIWSETIDPQTAFIPTLMTTAVTICSVLTYSMILADTLPALLLAYAGISLDRTTALLGLTVTVLLPLCLMRNLSSLAPFSLVGILGMCYTALVMLWRWQSGAYATAAAATTASSTLAALAPWPPQFGTAGWTSAVGSNAAILVSMLSTAYMAHYNAPKLYWELEEKNQFGTVCTVSFAGAIGLMASVAVAGFATFGANCQGLILQNYAVNDAWMGFSRLAVTVSLICSYPLAFCGVRDGLGDLLPVLQSYFSGVTVASLAGVTGLALILHDIGIIMAVGGATWGNCVIYVFPALMRIQYGKKHRKATPLAWCLAIAGVAMGVVGTTRALQSI